MSEKYFAGINYSMGNEDTLFERALIEDLKPKNIISVCGSGGRALPLLHEGIKSLTCVDLSKEQIFLMELRRETIRSLTFEEFVMFWGYPPFRIDDNTNFRMKAFVGLNLSKGCRGYFSKVFKEYEWESILYIGKWEQTFITLSKLARGLLGKHCDKLFESKTKKSHIKYMDNEFPYLRWKVLLGVLGNKALFDALLYKGSFVKKNIPESYFKFYNESFEHLFTEDAARKNFFLQLCFLGGIKFQEGNPVEAQEDVFNSMKTTLEKGVEVTSENCDLIAAIEKKKNIDFISMSDVPSYFSGDLEKNFLLRARDSLSKNGVVIVRSYLRVPEADRSGYQDITNKYKKFVSKEKVGVYKIEVLQRED